jgi:3-oxoacyl-[acyl-carrier protein] reductase
MELMELGLKGKTAIVLAASKGMGRATAFALAQEGARVALCSRSRKSVEQAVAEIGSATGAEVFGAALDVADGKARNEFLAEVAEQFGPPEVLVTNGGGPPHGSALATSDAEWDSAVDVGLLAPVRWVRAVAPGMKDRGWGRILMIESVSIKQPVDGLALSNVMRAGVAGFAKTLSRELAAHGVTVNVLAPGYTKTERLAALVETRAKEWGVSMEEAWERSADAVPAKRIAGPEELASFATFLASEKAGYITGNVLPVDGGLARGLL